MNIFIIYKFLRNNMMEIVQLKNLKEYSNIKFRTFNMLYGKLIIINDIFYYYIKNVLQNFKKNLHYFLSPILLNYELKNLL